MLPFGCFGIWVLGPDLGLNLQSLNLHHLNIWNLNISNQLPGKIRYCDLVVVVVLNLKAGPQYEYCKACVVPWRATVRVPYATTGTTVPRRRYDLLDHYPCNSQPVRYPGHFIDVRA